MNIHTMAMQISDKNWSVAAAILGSEVTSKPMHETYGSFVVINTFERGGAYSSPRARHSFNDGISLNNILLSGEDFQVMFDYDKRAKNLEHFFKVAQFAARPIKAHPDQRLDSAIHELTMAWNDGQPE